MDPATPSEREIESRLRGRDREIWDHVRRELRKHGEQRYAGLVQAAGVECQTRAGHSRTPTPSL